MSTQTKGLDEAENEAQGLNSRRVNDQRNFQQSLGALAELLDHGNTQISSVTQANTLLAGTLSLVLHAIGIKAVFKVTDPSLDAFDELQQLVEQVGVSMRSVKLEGRNWWLEDSGPLLATLKSTAKPVALLPIEGSRGYQMHDLSGTSARIVLLDESTSADLAAGAFMFFRKFPTHSIGLVELLRFGLYNSNRDWLTILACGLLGGGLALFTPVATGILVDEIIPNGRDNELTQLTALLVAAAFGVAAFELTRSLALLRLEGRLSNASEAAVIDRLMNLPVPFFKDYAAGDLAQRALTINHILGQLTNTTQSIVMTWVFSLFSFFYMFILNWQLGLVATGLVAMIVVVTVVANFLRLRLERKVYALQGAIASRILQILNGIGKIRTVGAENRAFALWARDFATQKKVDIQVRSLSNMLIVFNASFIVIASVCLFASIAYLQRDISTGVFVTFNTAFTQFLSSTLALASALTGSLSIIPLYERAKPILTALPEQQSSRVQASPLKGAVEISRVSFSYSHEGPLILDDISIRINRGEFVAFVGPSGSGKSTIFRILLGFETPHSGAVYYDNQDLTGLDARSVRRQLGVVLQNGKLMPGDIYTNIVGSAPRSIDEAWEAARMAGLADDIKAMPMGMQTVIAEGAGTISGGQRQRLMIARALVNRPAVLLFDEATSALDNQTQAIVANSVRELDATRIVIAHRLSTIMQADRIFVIVGGKVVETGNYQSLMTLNGHFAELSKRQQV